MILKHVSFVINGMIKMQGDLLYTFVLSMYFPWNLYGRNCGPILISSRNTQKSCFALLNFLVLT